MVVTYKKIPTELCAKSSFTLYWILHTSHNDFCLSSIPMLWLIGHRSLVERRSSAADLAHPKTLAWRPLYNKSFLVVKWFLLSNAVLWRGICYGDVAVCVFVAYIAECLSRWCIVPRRLSRSSCDIHRFVVQPLYSSHEPDNSTASPWCQMGEVVGKNRKIRPRAAIWWMTGQ